MGAGLIATRELLRAVKTRTFDAARAGQRAVEREHGRPITCARGCAHCCHVKLVVDVGQGAIIALHLIAEGRLDSALRARLLAADELQTRLSHREHFAAGHRCVFLDARGACSIHPVRPTHCALAFSVTDDPRRCGEVDGKALEFVRDPALVGAVSDLCADMLELLRLDERVAMTLPGAVLWAAARLLGEAEPPLFAMPADELTTGDRSVAEVFDERSAAWISSRTSPG